MAKKKAQAPKKANIEFEQFEETEKSPGKFQKILFWGIIPLLFATAIVLIVAEVTGTNVFEKAQQVTGLNAKEHDEDAVSKNYEKQIANMKAKLQESKAEVEKLQAEVESEKSKAQKAAIEKERLETELKKAQKSKESTNSTIKDIITTYEKMSPKAAAPAIAAMTDAQALKILTELKPDTLAAILEKMTAEDAARYTELLAKGK